VHRNIANIIQSNDPCSASVIEFAVIHVQVKHIVVCGHTFCDGVAAALLDKKLGILDTWLTPLRQLREQNFHILKSLDAKDAALKLAEINVRHGLRALSEKNVVLDAMHKRGLQLHGVLYDVGSGILKELDPEEPLGIILDSSETFATTKGEATDGTGARDSIWRFFVLGWGKKTGRRG
jgi:carbonic anhydrase